MEGFTKSGHKLVALSYCAGSTRMWKLRGMRKYYSEWPYASTWSRKHKGMQLISVANKTKFCDARGPYQTNQSIMGAGFSTISTDLLHLQARDLAILVLTDTEPIALPPAVHARVE